MHLQAAKAPTHGCFAGQNSSPSDLNPSPEPLATTPAPSTSEVGPFFSCISLANEEDGFLQNITNYINTTQLSDLATHYTDTINYTAAAEFVGDLQMAVDLPAINSDYQELRSVLNDGLSALGANIETLLADVNYTSVLNILANTPQPSENTNAVDAAYDFLFEFANSLNVTTLGQFLVNVSTTAQLPRIGGLIDNMLSNVNVTAVHSALATLPTVIDFAQVGNVTGQIVAATSVTGFGNATQDFIRDIGNNYLACPDQ